MEIHLKGGFSERKGIKHFSDIVQKDSLNERTRNRIYSTILDIGGYLKDTYYAGETMEDIFITKIYTELFSCAVDDVPYGKSAWNMIKVVIRESDYSDVFTLIEGIIKILAEAKSLSSGIPKLKNMFVESVNQIFKEENVNYHIISNLITDITTEEQVESIDYTLSNEYDVVSKHYQNALKLLYDSKDYSNSIKESISSVEAMCQIIDGSKKTLGDIIKKLNIGIHPALEKAYSTLYGYTSDENGTRHANGIGEKNATFEEARYMLVSCSAFVNYLMDLYENIR